MKITSRHPVKTVPAAEVVRHAGSVMNTTSDMFLMLQAMDDQLIASTNPESITRAQISALMAMTQHLNSRAYDRLRAATK